MIKSFCLINRSWIRVSLKCVRLCSIACCSLMYCIGFNAYAHDPLSVHKMGFEWLYLVNNATGFDLAVDGSLVAENATTLHAATTMTLQNVSCRDRGKDLSC